MNGAMVKKIERLQRLRRLNCDHQPNSLTRKCHMQANRAVKTKLSSSTYSIAFALCTGAAMLANAGSALAQVDPNVKVGASERAAPISVKGEHNPPGYKCGHNPPTYKSDKAADTRALSPAELKAEEAKKLAAAKAEAAACANK
jgi:hypothetical protein